jgi:PAS domain S-box-containing protein
MTIQVSTKIDVNHDFHRLGENEEMFLQFADNYQGLIIIFDQYSGKVLYVNPNYEKIWGQNPESLYENSTVWSSFIHPDDIERVAHAYQEAEGKGGFDQEYRIVRPDGSIRWIWGRCFPIKNSSGEIYRIAAIGEEITRRKLAEIELKKTNEELEAKVKERTKELEENKYFLQKIINTSPNIIYIYDLETDKITYINSEVTNKIGYTSEEITSMESSFFPTVIHADDLQKVKNHTRKYAEAQDGDIYEIEYRLKHKNGEYLHFSMQEGIFLKDGNNQVKQIIGNARDITANKLTQQTLNITEKRLQALLDHAPSLIYIKDLQGNILLTNKPYMVDKKEEQIIPDNIHKIQENDQQVLLTKKYEKFEEQIWQKDGLKTYFSIKFPLLDDQGNAHAIGGISTDITERKQIEEKLKESEEKYRLLTETVPNLIWVADPGGGIYEVNNGFKIYLGLSIEELKGNQWLNIIHPDDKSKVLEHWHESLYSSQPFFGEYRLQGADGLYHWYVARALPLWDENKKIKMWIGSYTDITHIKKAEAEMLKSLEKEKELNKLRANFIAMASHEFRTPLSVISSSAGILESYNNLLNEEQKKCHLDKIQSKVKCMTQLMDDVLLINQAESEKLKFNPELLNLVTFCENIIDELTGINHLHQIKFNLFNHGNNQNFDFPIDKKLMQYILGNLLNNAIKYSPVKTDINLTLNITDREIIFTIEDKGIGIPSEEMDLLFNSFYRCKNVGKIKGTGLGLSIAKRYVELHQGTIMVNSQVGVGTTFIVTIPQLYN